MKIKIYHPIKKKVTFWIVFYFLGLTILYSVLPEGWFRIISILLLVATVAYISKLVDEFEKIFKDKF